jgi:hypothetical protein
MLAWKDPAYHTSGWRFALAKVPSADDGGQSLAAESSRRRGSSSPRQIDLLAGKADDRVAYLAHVGGLMAAPACWR